MNLKDNPGDYLKKSGPNNEEAKVIREMHGEGAKPADVKRALPDIDPAAIDRWLESLDKELEEKTKPKKKDPPPPLDPLK
jgi:hypothetical protein